MTTNPLRTILAASKVVLQERRYTVWLAVLAILFIAAYVFIPVWLTPGNSIAFQLQILRPKDYALFVVLSSVTALLVVMQAYIIGKSRARKNIAAAVGSGGAGVYSALFGGLLATAACSSCVAVLLGFLGAGGVLFVVNYRWYFIAGAIALVLVALYFTARRIVGLCEDCRAPRSPATGGAKWGEVPNNDKRE